jgi:uncharacterized protein YqeY
MSLVTKIDNDLVTALKAGEKEKVTLLRGLKSDIKYRRIDKGDDLSDDEVLGVLSSAAKRRKDSIEQFKAGNRDDQNRAGDETFDAFGQGQGRRQTG